MRTQSRFRKILEQKQELKFAEINEEDDEDLTSKSNGIPRTMSVGQNYFEFEVVNKDRLNNGKPISSRNNPLFASVQTASSGVLLRQSSSRTRVGKVEPKKEW